MNRLSTFHTHIYTQLSKSIELNCYNISMVSNSKSRVLGAFVVGFAIVAGAYILNSLTPSIAPSVQPATVAQAPTRVFIETNDTNKNGLEDWREQFVENSPAISLDENGEEYTLPQTLTGQVGISFFQSIVTAKGTEGFGRSKEQIIKDTAETISKYGADTIFDINDIVTKEDNSAEAIRTYANAAADAIIINDVPGSRDELTILKELLSTENEQGIAELKAIAQIYQKTLDATLKLTVPSRLAKEHLDLINVYHALAVDTDAMTKALDDPMLSLVRIKRYQDDAEGLALALQNMYNGIKPYTSSFNENDSALLFFVFNPKSQ